MTMKFAILMISTLAMVVGCNTIKTEHTVHITMDVNVKLDRELDDFFGDLDDFSETMEEDIRSETSAPESE